MTRILRTVGFAFLWFILALLTLWAIAALYVDFRIAALRIPVALAYVVTVVAILLKDKPRLWEASLFLAGFGIVLIWWLSLKPSNDRDWQADVARTAWTEIDGDRVTIHNLRNCDYTSRAFIQTAGTIGRSTCRRSKVWTLSLPPGECPGLAIRLSALFSRMANTSHSP